MSYSPAFSIHTARAFRYAQYAQDSILDVCDKGTGIAQSDLPTSNVEKGLLDARAELQRAIRALNFAIDGIRHYDEEGLVAY